jgi:hypothetical protein
MRHRRISIRRHCVPLVIPLAVVLGLLQAGCSDETNPVVAEDHAEAEGLLLRTAQGDTAVRYFRGALREGDTLRAPAGGTSVRYTATLLDSSGAVMATPSPSHTFGWNIADTSVAGAALEDGEAYVFHIIGRAAGATRITLLILHGDHADFTTIPIPVLVGPALLPPDRPGGRTADAPHRRGAR